MSPDQSVTDVPGLYPVRGARSTRTRADADEEAAADARACGERGAEATRRSDERARREADGVHVDATERVATRRVAVLPVERDVERARDRERRAR